MIHRDRRLAMTLLLFSFISFSTHFQQVRRYNACTCFSPVRIKLNTVQHSLSFPVSWCVVSEAEEQKCLDLAGSATARNIRGTLLCVRGQSPTDCMEKIKNGTADAAAMFADDIYTAGWCFGLELAAGESYNGVDGISYYVVALARRSSSDLSLLEMHERSSCHPGIRTTVGWTVPIGFLVNTSQISVDEQCNFPKAVGDFFGNSCVPGVKDREHDPRGSNPKNLCEACIGDDNERHICVNNHRERHYGEAGALRCVAENLGDVAFVKHTTISDNMDGNNMESWAMDLELEDLKLLCPDGSEAGPFDHETCHLAVVPANAVVVRLEDKCRVWKYLERLQVCVCACLSMYVCILFFDISPPLFSLYRMCLGTPPCSAQ
uniref:Otolith matrix protein n=1 Tax=Oncorhynchus mykiss TaxID=8022 RepID=A0A8C7SCC2_ONCMY